MSFNEIDLKNFSSISSLYGLVLGKSEFPHKLSDNWAELLGHTTEKLYEIPYLDFFHPELLKESCSHLILAAQGIDQEFTTKVLAKDGHEVVMVWSAHRGEDSCIYIVAQRVSITAATSPSIKPLEFDRDSFIVKLTEMELRIFICLEKNINKLVSKDVLSKKAYSTPSAHQSLNVHIHNLRKKLEKFPLNIKSVGKSGWMLVFEKPKELNS